jgi:hypothetical protein
MTCRSFWLVLALFLTGPASAVRAQVPVDTLIDDVPFGRTGGLFNLLLPKDEPTRPVLLEKVYRKVDFPGFEKADTTFYKALDQLARRYDLTFDVYEPAFDRDGTGEVLKAQIGKLPPQRDVPVIAVLEQILARVPSTSGYTWYPKRSYIQITTRARVAAEIEYLLGKLVEMDADTRQRLYRCPDFVLVERCVLLGHLAKRKRALMDPAQRPLE